MKKIILKRPFSVIFVTLLGLSIAASVQAEETIKMDKRAQTVPYDPSVFSPDPSYEKTPYSIENQLQIYGGKSAVVGPRPLLELGRPIYQSGPFDEASYAFGAQNPSEMQFTVYGDWRTAIAVNDNGVVDVGVLATRLNLDFDFKITSTERFHAVMTPLEKDGRFTRHEFSGTNVDLEDANALPPNVETSAVEDDFVLDALFFEGDLGNLVSGSGNYSTWDLPFAIGLMPLLFQNGVWLDDAFTGLAVTIPARNSRALDISNYDITFFAGFDKVNSAIGNENDVSIFGVTTFMDAMSGYWEMGYGFTKNDDPLADGSDYHNLTAAFSRRYAGWLSNSVRVIINVGQDLAAGTETADGTLILIENSFITSSPLTSIPYLNIFIGNDTPQSLARAGAAGGVLKNTGINFETDGLTGFPTLDATANETVGFAAGWEYLFSLNQQLVVELAMLVDNDDDESFAGNGVPGDQVALGVRYQRPLSKSWIIRADAMVASRDGPLADDLSGVRVEIRKKF